MNDFLILRCDVFKQSTMKTFTLVILLAFVQIISLAQSDTLSAGAAIERAEQFIRINGYTSDLADTTKMTREFIYDDEMSKSAIARKRRNTLQPHATYISTHEKEWYIGFLYTDSTITAMRKKNKRCSSTGRGLIIAKDLSEMRMAHKNPLFEKWQRIK